MAQNALGVLYALECDNDIAKGLEWWRKTQDTPWWEINSEKAYRDRTVYNGLVNYYYGRGAALERESIFWLRQAARGNNQFETEWRKTSLTPIAKELASRPLLEAVPLKESKAFTVQDFQTMLALPEKDIEILDRALKGDNLAQHSLSEMLSNISRRNFSEAYFWTLMPVEDHETEWIQEFKKKIKSHLSNDVIKDTEQRAADIISKL